MGPGHRHIGTGRIMGGLGVKKGEKMVGFPETRLVSTLVSGGNLLLFIVVPKTFQCNP